MPVCVAARARRRLIHDRYAQDRLHRFSLFIGHAQPQIDLLTRVVTAAVLGHVYVQAVDGPAIDESFGNRFGRLGTVVIERQPDHPAGSVIQRDSDRIGVLLRHEGLLADEHAAAPSRGDQG